MSQNTPLHHHDDQHSRQGFHTHQCIIHFIRIAYLYNILIQHELTPADLSKKVEFFYKLRHYTRGDVSVFNNMFFFNNVAWFHLCRRLHKHVKLTYLEFGEPACFSNNVVVYQKNRRLVRYQSQTCNGTNFFATTIDRFPSNVTTRPAWLCR